MPLNQVFSAYEGAGRPAGTPYRHCPLCATSLLPGESVGPRATCPACGWVHYRNPSPGVVALITDGDRVLLGKRGPDSFAPDLWCLPGGFIEFEEDFLTAAVREVREETGLCVAVKAILNVTSNFLSPGLHTLAIVVHARIVGGDPVPGDDISALGWFPVRGPLPDLAFEADRHILERFRDPSGIPIISAGGGKGLNQS